MRGLKRLVSTKKTKANTATSSNATNPARILIAIFIMIPSVMEQAAP
jgi:hypothetical protein